MALHPENLQMQEPLYPIDQIYGSASGTTFSPAPTAIQGNTITTVTGSLPTGESCYMEGIFSTDGGNTWNTFAVNQPNLSTPGQPVFQTISAQGYTQPGTYTITITNWYDNVHSTSASYNVMWKVVFFAKNGQSVVPPSNTSQILRYNSEFNYQKIFLSGILPLSPAGNVVNVWTVPHNLGYVPKFRAFTECNTSPYPAGQLATLDNIGGYRAAADATNLYFIDDESGSAGPPVWPPVNMHYRVYLDR